MELFREHYDQETLRAMPVLTLAHIGDGVYELLARSAVVAQGKFRVEEAHLRTVALVAAPAQAKAAHALVPHLTSEEKSAFSGDATPSPIPRPATARWGEYAYATGLEALFGVLYLSGQDQRLLQLWETILEVLA